MPSYHYYRVSIILATLVIISNFSLYSTSANVKKTKLENQINVVGPANRSESTDLVREIREIESSNHQQQEDMSNEIHMLPTNTLLTKDRRKQSKRFQDVQRKASSTRNRISTSSRPALMPSAASLVEKWTVEIKGDSREADNIAKSLDCHNLGLVKGFTNIYLFEKNKKLSSATGGDQDYLTRAKRDFKQTADKLRSHKNVVWVEPQTALTRVKRSSIMDFDTALRMIPNNVYQQRSSLAPTSEQYILQQPPQQQTIQNYPLPTTQTPYNQQHQYHQISSNIHQHFGQQQQQSYPLQYHHQQQQQQQHQSHQWLLPSTTFVPNSILTTTTTTYNQQAPTPPQSPSQVVHQQYVQSERKMSNGASSSSGQQSTFNDYHVTPINRATASPVIEAPSTSPTSPTSASSTSSTSIRPAAIKSQQKTSDYSTTASTLISQIQLNQKHITYHNIASDVRDVFSRGYSPSVSNEDRNKYDDELWMHQWYLQDNSNNAHIQSGMHLHVQDVWKMGYTGKNVVVSVIDDGIEWNHTDLMKNYDARASYDMNNNDSDPFPRYDQYETNSHGTRCAGEIAMVSNNKKCGVGVAPDARIGGIKSLDGDVSDHIESMSLLHNLDYIDIYSGSWGPKDDGITLEGPKRLAAQALEDGVNRGRKGRGAIYVWANGNGGVSGDNCNCDGYVSSLYTLAVGSVTQKGQFPFYGERCSSTLAVTCSSGTYSDKKITTTDLHNRCTTDYSGTSAAAPLAAGILALVLEANPNITWRDAQHLVAWTSEYYPLKDNTGWFRNKAGLMFNNKFGFGLMNAKSLVDTALSWTNVPKKSICSINAEESALPKVLVTGIDIDLEFYTDGCNEKYHDLLRSGQTIDKDYPPSIYNPDSPDVKQLDHPVNYLEHVQVILTIEYPVRGDIDIYLRSPSGTTSSVLTYRPMDKSMLGFTDWTFMSVHYWGETPQGTWVLIVRDKMRASDSKLSRGYLVNATLILHGTTAKPDHMNRARIYDGEDQIKYTLEKSSASLDKNEVHTIYDENPWDQNNYPNDMSQVSPDVDEGKLVTAKMVDTTNIRASK